MEYEVLFYQNETGRSPGLEFFQELPPKIRGKAMQWIQKLVELGPDLPRPYADILRGKIRELRIIFGNIHVRFLYFFHDKKVIITHGFIKKTMAVPESEISRAEMMMVDYLRRCA
jgi:phage-related protein